MQMCGISRIFQPTLPARGATRLFVLCPCVDCLISTHAPRTGSDGKRVRQTGDCLSQFQPTLPARGATARHGFQLPRTLAFQPTLPARGATRHRIRHRGRPAISTHAPRTGSDEQKRAAQKARYISTHAPRTGSDMHRACRNLSMTNFNPRSPHGERPITSSSANRPRNFNPRSPHGERRPGGCRRVPQQEISTHAPRTGSDVTRVQSAARADNFNPRSPHGERQTPGLWHKWMLSFQPTLPARGATRRLTRAATSG